MNRNDEGGFNNFDTQQTTEDQFRVQQNNDFPREDDFNTQQQFINDFQNNEVGSDYPNNPYSNDDSNYKYDSRFYDRYV